MDKQTLAKGLRFVEEFRKIDPEMQLQTVATFMSVAVQPGITMKELADRLGISQASCSRNVAALSKWHRMSRPGHDLVEAVEDPAERRRKIVHLTPKGKRIAQTIWEILDREKKASDAVA